MKSQNKEKVRIRKAKKENLKSIADVFRIEYGKRPYNEKWNEKDCLKRVKQYFKHSKIAVLEVDDKVSGFIMYDLYLWYDGLRGYIQEIAIFKEHQGKGYGRKLIDYFENVCKKKGITKISLHSHNKSKAFKIYNKLGFKEDKTLVYMIKKLRK